MHGLQAVSITLILEFFKKLNDDLKPFLLQLKEHYTQYTLDNIMAMKSTYSIRIFELLQEKIKTKVIGRSGKYVQISLQELRECCDCEDKYKAFGDFKKRVVDKAVSEINRVTYYDLTFSYQKCGRNVAAIDFFITSKFRHKKK